MGQFEQHEGVWVGTNAFRLMPGDVPSDAPMKATISRAAKGALTQIAYTWVHPDDGEQDGLLVIGHGEESSTAVAFWGDSWHQSPEPRTLEGTIDGEAVTLVYNYGGDWRWEVIVDASAPDQVVLTMNNVIPESAATAEISAGAYAAMRAELRRAP